MSGTVLISHLDSRGIFLLSGELGIGLPCCAAQVARDPSETPPQHEGWSSTGGGGECRCARVVVQVSRRGSLRDGCGRCAPLDATSRLYSPRAEKQGATTLHTHTCSTTHSTARCVSRVTCVCSCVASGIVALCRHVNE